MDEEVGLVVVVGLLKVAIRAHAVEARLMHQTPDIVFPQRKHVQRVFAPVRECVFEARQSVVNVLGLCRDLIAAVVVLVLRREAVIEHLVVISLVENQNSVVPQRRVELGKSLTTILLGVQMRERVAEADYGVVLPMYGAVQLPPMAWTVLRMSPCFRPFSNALASMAAEPSTLVTSNPASVRRTE